MYIALLKITELTENLKNFVKNVRKNYLLIYQKYSFEIYCQSLQRHYSLKMFLTDNVNSVMMIRQKNLFVINSTQNKAYFTVI